MTGTVRVLVLLGLLIADSDVTGWIAWCGTDTLTDSRLGDVPACRLSILFSRCTLAVCCVGSVVGEEVVARDTEPLRFRFCRFPSLLALRFVSSDKTLPGSGCFAIPFDGGRGV